MRSSTSPPTSWSRAPRHPKVVAIGEAGLDYHYDYSPRDAQEQGFRNHIAAARATGLPLVIHSRDADEDMARDPGGGNGEGRLPGRAALLHRRPRSRAARDRARPLHLVHRHSDLQEVGRAARDRQEPAGRPHPGRDRRALSRARAAIAASATSRPTWSRPPRCWPRRAASRSTRSPGRRPRISSACSARSRGRQPAQTGSLRS